MIQSRWKLTLDPTGTPRVLLDAGETLTEGELPWQLDHAFEAISLIDADWQFLRDGGNSVVSLDFTVRRAALTDVAARTAMMDALVTEAATAVKPLKIQLATEAGVVAGYHYLFSQCGVKAYAPKRSEEGKKAYSLHRYSLFATQGSKVLTP